MDKLALIPMLFLPLFLHAQAPTSADTLHVYGPGGPLGPINECAELFSQQTGHPVKVVAGPDPDWIDAARKNGDIFFSGAEYMFTQFMNDYPNLVDPATRTELYARRAGILVRPGNPKGIRSLADLAKPGIGILDVNGSAQVGLWEDLVGRQGFSQAIQANIRQTFLTGAAGIAAWKQDSRYDAWITFTSWHQRLKEETELVPIPPSENLFRSTPIALSSFTKQAALARQFLAFMKTEPMHEVFKKWGWE
ncbi:substrate-binding domain-containing protein [Spirosoma arcticum]